MIYIMQYGDLSQPGIGSKCNRIYSYLVGIEIVKLASSYAVDMDYLISHFFCAHWK